MSGQPTVIETEEFVDLSRVSNPPAPLHFTQRPYAGARAVMRTPFIEGPAIDSRGNLYVTDMSGGRIYRIGRDRRPELVLEYEGEPNGLKVSNDSELYIADRRLGILLYDLEAETLLPIVEGPELERFRGVNDLCFDSAGTLYFTDQGQSGLQDPSGCVYELRHQVLRRLLTGIPSPNGIVIDEARQQLYVAVTRANSVWRVPLSLDDLVSRVGVYIQLSGGHAGPDGLAMCRKGRLAVAHAGLGVVWIFSELGEPIARVESCAGLMTTNIAFDHEQRFLYITESDSGKVLRADVSGL